MTIKDILNTPISEMWNAVSPFVTIYLIFYAMFFVFILSFIIFVALQVAKGHKEFKAMWNKRINRK